LLRFSVRQTFVTLTVHARSTQFETRKQLIIQGLHVNQVLVLRPRCDPEKMGTNKKKRVNENDIPVKKKA
jgi:hypothetical protein